MSEISEAIAKAGREEGLPSDSLGIAVRDGQIVALGERRGIPPVLFGEGTCAKYDVIVGLSSAGLEISDAVDKAKLAASLGASAIHDGSPIGPVDELARRLLHEVPIPVGLCHPLRAAAKEDAAGRSFYKLRAKDFVDYFEADAKAGTDFILAPYALTRRALERSSGRERIMLSPNKTGSMVLGWMARSGAENPYFEHFDEILDIAKTYGVALSIVNGLRAGAVRDAADVYQEEELQDTCEIVRRAKEKRVPITVGSGGHLPLHLIEPYIKRQRELLKTPLIAFGPTPTDIGAGFDHVVAAVGQAFALRAGASAVVAITAAEHLALPTTEETKEACMIARLVCHMADVSRGRGAEIDERMSRAREALDWETQFSLSPDPERARKIRWRSDISPVCSMCGTACAYPASRGAARLLQGLGQAGLNHGTDLLATPDVGSS